MSSSFCRRLVCVLTIFSTSVSLISSIPVEALERAAVDRDLVGRDSGVRPSAPRERDALVEAEKRQAGRRLVLDDELDVGHIAAEVVRKRFDRLCDTVLERDATVWRP